jgi:hypothetical protein
MEVVPQTQVEKILQILCCVFAHVVAMMTQQYNAKQDTRHFEMLELAYETVIHVDFPW